MRGDVVALAVAVIIAQSFGTEVTALVDNIIMPLVALIGGQPDFNSIGFNINDTRFGVGALVTAIVSFLIVAAVVFFFVVKPFNMLLQRSKGVPPADPIVKQCPACLSVIPTQATRCAFCTSELSTVAS